MSRDKQIRTAVLRQRWVALISLIVYGLTAPANASEERGDLGGDFRLLRSSLISPRVAGESNFFIDMWEGQNLQAVVAVNGLTNNHTLFVNCHGKYLSEGGRAGHFAFYPHQSLIKTDAETPYYSVRDLATVVGAANIPTIHNLVLAACNAEGALSTKELRKFFPNATNIVHCVAGELGYQPMFLQAIMNCSWTIKPVYEWREQNEKGQVQYVTGHTPTHGAKRLAPYTAELFRRGVEEPFRVQRAGRELLDPHHGSRDHDLSAVASRH